MDPLDGEIRLSDSASGTIEKVAGKAQLLSREFDHLDASGRDVQATLKDVGDAAGNASLEDAAEYTRRLVAAQNALGDSSNVAVDRIRRLNEAIIAKQRAESQVGGSNRGAAATTGLRQLLDAQVLQQNLESRTAGASFDDATGRLERYRQAHATFIAFKRSIPAAVYGIPGLGQLLDGAELATSLLPQLGRGALLAGAGIAAVGAAGFVAVEGIKKTWQEMERLERKQFALEQLKQRFGDAEQVIRSTQQAIEGIASKEQVFNILVALDKASVHASEGQINALATVIQDRAFKIGADWTEMMTQVGDAIGKADGAQLESMRLIDSADQAYLDYAESVGKLVPQLTQVERQQALVNRVLIQNKDAVAQMDSPIENLRQAEAELSATTADLGVAFLDWAVSLLDPSARSAADWWAEKLRGIVQGAQEAENTLNLLADRRKARAQLGGDQLVGFDALNDQANKLYEEIDRKVLAEAARRGVSADQVNASELAKTDPALKALLDKYKLVDDAVKEAIKTANSGGDVLSLPAVQDALSTQKIESFRFQISSLNEDIAGIQTNLKGATSGSQEQAQLQGALDTKINELNNVKAQLATEEAKISGALQTPAERTETQRTQLAGLVDSLDQDIEALQTKIEAAKGAGGRYQQLQEELADLLKQRDILFNADPVTEALKAKGPDEQLRNQIAGNAAKLQSQINALYQQAAQASNNGNVYVADESITKARELEKELTVLKAQLADMPPFSPLSDDEVTLAADKILTELGNVDKKIEETRAKLQGANVDLISPESMQKAQEQLDELLAQRTKVQTELNDLNASTAAASAPPIPDALLASVAVATEQLKGQNSQINGLDFDQFKSSFESAATAVQQSTAALNQALVSGDQTLIQQAKQINDLARARYDSLQSIAQVTVAEAALQTAQAGGAKSEIDYATATLKAAEAHRDAAAAAYENATAGLSVEAAQVNLAQAEKILAEAKARGNEAAIQQAELMVSLAQSALVEAQAVGEAATKSSEFAYVGGLILDQMTGLPVAFDRSALSAQEFTKALASVSSQMQTLQYNAQNTAFSLSQRLVPSLGLRGALGQGNQWAQEAKLITGGIEQINKSLVDAGRAPLAPQILELGLQSLNAKWQAQLQQMLPTDKMAKQAEQDAKRVNSAVDGIASGILQPTTQGLIDIDSILPREDAVDEKARRMADVAKKGFQSPWFEGLKDLFPPDVLLQGEGAVKLAAAQMVRDHQKGLTTMFYDVDTAAQQVLERINAKAAQNDLVDKVREKVKGLADVSNVDIKKALGIELTPQEISKETMQSLNFSIDEFLKEVAGAVSGKESPLVAYISPKEEDIAKITAAGATAGTDVGTAFTAQIREGNFGGLAIVELNAQVQAKKADAEQTGKDIASWSGGAYLTWWKENVPPGLLSILTDELVPLIEAQVSAKEERKSGGK